jgi:ankyrin repeat protein
MSEHEQDPMTIGQAAAHESMDHAFDIAGNPLTVVEYSPAPILSPFKKYAQRQSHFPSPSGTDAISDTKLEPMQHFVKVESNAELQSRDVDAEKHFEQAAQHGDLDAVKMLVEQGPSGIVASQDNVAIRIASANGHASVVAYLLAHNADVSASFHQALRLSAKQGHVEVVRMLIEAGSQVGARNNHALRAACGSYSAMTNDREAYLEIIRMLVNAGADPHVNGDELIYEAMESNDSVLSSILLSRQ